MALGKGTPAFYVRQPEDTIKGQMYTDLSVGEWAPHIEQISGPALAELVLAALNKEEQSRRRALDAAHKAQTLQLHGMQRVSALL
jgi:hypothetical protein